MAYGVVPHQWLTWAENELNWRSDQLLAGPGEIFTTVLPFELTYLVLKDIVATIIYGGFLAAMGVATRMGQFEGVFGDTSEALGVVLAATVIFAVGLVDDLREVSAPAKVAGQVLAGSLLSLFGVTMLFFRIPFGDIVLLSPDLAPLVTVLWVVGMANAVNLIDGLDGLAAGIVAIAAGAFFLYADRLFEENLLPDNSVSPLIVIIVLGMCLGFLPHNFHPARIFMGDGGSMLLGLLMATPTLLVGGQTNEGFSGQTFFFFAPLFIPFFILGVPIFDMAFAIVRRARAWALGPRAALIAIAAADRVALDPPATSVHFRCSTG
ncbi:MAG: undecaprenyl/decaprenyl-phosphate alpha-N-acetylglucosaminyl 1-phosphate transferase [Actinobacteria bacterium]|nr:undecaprenyl/decaprenyl-phosphate alpha-N-acetylglucosaminyl 1-phosphate transferase [Actinomycetota bacterium]